jgi:hypothetical protein
MRIEIFLDNTKLVGYADTTRPVDYKEVFPKEKIISQLPPMLMDWYDEYGNGQYEIRISETENGKQAEVVKKRMAPTAEQIARRKKQLFRQYYSYDRDDEIALMKDAINALQVGKEIPETYTQMELDRAAAKREADDEIEADLFKIADEHKGA